MNLFIQRWSYFNSRFLIFYKLNHAVHNGGQIILNIQVNGLIIMKL